jgi:hypothetical protein
MDGIVGGTAVTAVAIPGLEASVMFPNGASGGSVVAAVAGELADTLPISVTHIAAAMINAIKGLYFILVYLRF